MREIANSKRAEQEKRNLKDVISKTKSVEKLKGTGKRIIPLLILMLSTGCSFITPTVRVKVDSDCIWFQDQSFSAETKEWLRLQMPWPDHLREDLDRVADNNDLAKIYCKD